MVVGAKDCGESGKRIRIRRTTNSRREAYSERCRWSFAEAYFYLYVGSCLVYYMCCFNLLAFVLVLSIEALCLIKFRAAYTACMGS